MRGHALRFAWLIAFAAAGPGVRVASAQEDAGARDTAAARAAPAAGAVAGRGAQAAVLGDTIRVGDVVPVAVRVVVEPGQRVAFPDTLPPGDDRWENAARVRVRLDTLGDGRVEATGVYTVTPWRVGELPLPALEVPVVSGRERVRTVTASLPALQVTSVLPTDTAGLEPKPAKGVIGRNWAWWPILLALLALLALIAALIWWLRRRRGADGVSIVPAVPPRERALARLQEARESGLVEAGRWKEFYTRIAEAVREYVADLEPAWGEDLTSTEVAARMRREAGVQEAAGLVELLRAADQVKFARRVPDAETAVAEWDAARRWVLAFSWPPPRPEEAPEAAA